MTEKQLAQLIMEEIIFGADALLQGDVEEIVNAFNLDISLVRELTEQIIRAMPQSLEENTYTIWDEKSLEKDLKYWFK